MFKLPTFNIVVNLWRSGNVVTNPPDTSAVANFNIGKRISGGDYFSANIVPQWFATCWLLVPKGTLIVGDTTFGLNGDTAEIPAGAGLFYHVVFSERSALGFANEHVAAIVVQALPPVPAGAIILMEDGSSVLMEDGTLMLME